jgi:hypothetical protein
LKRKYRIEKAITNRENMKISEKMYKKTMDKALNTHRRKMEKEIKIMKTNNSKDYWKLLKSKNKREEPDIPITSLYDFFVNLNATPEANENDDLPPINPNDANCLNEQINTRITQEEILKCVKTNTNNKACGDDLVIKEYIKSTTEKIIELCEKMLNIIFQSGVIPDSWLNGNMKPIYKNKGYKTGPQHFRPITVLSYLGKLLASILSERLTQYSDEFIVQCENQTEFRTGYSTLDNFLFFTLFFSIFKKKIRKKSYIVDFAKVFDTVWRHGLWHQLLLNNMNGNMFNVIVNMYKDTKSRIVYKNSMSEIVPCSNGVR